MNVLTGKQLAIKITNKNRHSKECGSSEVRGCERTRAWCCLVLLCEWFNENLWYSPRTRADPKAAM